MATQKEIANHLGLSDRQIRNLIADGILPASKGKGGMDLDDCRYRYIDYLRGQKTGQVKKAWDEDFDAEPGDIVAGINVPEQEARKKLYDADTKEHRLNVLRKEFVPIELLIYSVSKISEMLIANLNSLPMKMKVSDPTLNARSIDAAKREIAELCNGLADFELDLSDYTPSDPESDYDGFAAPSDIQAANSG